MITVAYPIRKPRSYWTRKYVQFLFLVGDVLSLIVRLIHKLAKRLMKVSSYIGQLQHKNVQVIDKILNPSED